MKTIAFLTALVVCAGVYSQSNMENLKDELKRTDVAFSDLSKNKGMREAFLAYIDSSGVLLRPHSMPIEGFDAVRKLLNEDNSEFSLTWSPLFADVSNSGELGYTYGIFELVFTDEQGKSVTRKGTYVSIWKMDKMGKWKFVLDTGNPGLEPPEK